jgi:hypothetical protein
MNKTSADLHWVLATSITEEGQRAFYVKIFGRLPDAPIEVRYLILDRIGNKTHQTTTLDACCATDSLENILESGSALSVYDKQLAKVERRQRIA